MKKAVPKGLGLKAVPKGLKPRPLGTACLELQAVFLQLGRRQFPNFPCS